MRRHSSSVVSTAANNGNHLASPRPDAGDLSSAAANNTTIPSPVSIEHGADRLPVDQPPRTQQQQQQQHSARATSAQSSRNSPEPSQNDQQGHYVGPASGASFLLRIQRKLLRQQTGLLMQSSTSTDQSSSIFTFGDLPLPEADEMDHAGFFVLPPQQDAEALLARYFDFAAATHRFLHRPTVEGWLAELYETNGAMRDSKAAARSRLALLFMVFAQAGNYRAAGMTGREYSRCVRWLSFGALKQLESNGGVEFPTCVNDSDLHLRHMHPSPIKSQSLMSGCIAHMRDSSSDGGGGGGKLAYHVQCCLDAATNIVRVVDELTRSGQIYSTFWFTHYFAFCAVVVLYVHTIQQQQRRLPPPSTTTDNEQPSSHYRAASRCHDQISRIATKGSLAERYGVVLQELRMELLRHGSVDGGGGDVGGVQRQQQEIDVGMAVPVVAPPPVLAQPVFQQQQQDGLGLDGLQQQQGIEAFAEASPSSSIAAQMTGWGQFDSLVSAAELFSLRFLFFFFLFVLCAGLECVG
ncbi:hypothetical protein BK809_0003882 [Diplodia seriata]|uniref:Uncharacterized protein n=1 Tax=Diplodia seriata TaxID=420778 RepID=A0A1S8BCL0_9PEZI|nr:hypothetical protein BK809_0003882 [Diplodia seriata]